VVGDSSPASNTLGIDAKYRSLYRNTPVMMHSIDPSGRIVSVSELWLSSLGYEESEVIGRPSVDFLTEESRALALNVILPEFFRTGACRNVAYQFVKKDGTPMDVELSAIVERDANGEIARSLAVLTDVTERNRMLRRLQASELAIAEGERRYRGIFENAGVSLWEEDISDVKTFLANLRARGVGDLREYLVAHPDEVIEAARRVRVENVNAETVRFYGARTKEELLGALSKTFLPATYDVFREELVALDQGRARFASEAEVRTLQGERRNILMTIVFPSQPGERALVSTLDITERKNLEERLRHSQKMEAVGQLAGGIAHDFNNLLAVILGRSELLLRVVPSDPEVASHLELIRETVMHATYLTSHLLAFSRRQVMQPRVVDLNEIVADTLEMIRGFIGEDIEIRERLANDLHLVRVDPGQIGQVVLNLALNARDAMPNGGQLSIETTNSDAEEGAVVLRIGDTGHGMDAVTSVRIFEPFFTTKGPGRGTGLGLSTVYGIVEQSGGRIWVESSPGEGAAFFISLPRATSGVVEHSPPSSSEEPARGDETVLLAEDEPAVRAVTSAVLESHGYRVLSAGNAAQALAIATRHEGPIHLLVTDVVMPDTHGHELATRMRELREDIRVLYISGYTPERVDLEGAPVLMKPFASKSLLGAVRAVLGGPVR
jgi:two-component system, cell cycle sensor histidine kinase and response regulator CckA